jgi:hypothetical protein
MGPVDLAERAHEFTGTGSSGVLDKSAWGTPRRYFVTKTI